MLGRTISHYRILEKLGQGGMGEVYLAEDTELGRRVAVKFLVDVDATDPDALTRFRREAQAAASLDHPNVITIHEVSLHEGRPFIVMAYVEGAPLSASIGDESLRIDKVLKYALQIAEGLARAHDAGIVHRDVKPANVIIDTADNVRILDFGLAKVTGATKLTDDSVTLGTAFYMSPEQVRSSDVDHRSDLFSLGTILYEMVTGRLPFRGENAAAVAHSITTEEPQPLARFSSSASPELQRIVRKALAKDPDERYQSATDLAADLRRESRLTVEGAATVVMPSVEASHVRRQRRWIVPVAVLAIVSLLFVARRLPLAGRTNAPTTDENTLAIMYFDNKADREDEQRLGEIITDLLITHLSESSSMTVISSQRLYDLLKLEGKEGLKKLDSGTSTDVARRAGARWMLLGSLLRTQPEIVATSQIVDIATGQVASSQRVGGAEEEDIFVIADRLADEIRRDMDLSVTSTTPADVKVSTQSVEAYRYYLEGLDLYNRFERSRARQSFQRAVEIDSTFAMAYFQLARSAPGETGRVFVEKAWAHARNVTRKERLWIDAKYKQLHDDVSGSVETIEKIIALDPDDKEAHLQLGTLLSSGDPQGAIRHLHAAIEIDPLFKLPYNTLAYIYEAIGDFGQSIWAINKYIEVAPDEYNPYDTRGDLYAWAGKVDEAIASYRKALEINPDSEFTIWKLGHQYRAKRDYAAAASTYRRLLSSESPRTRSYARCYLAHILAYQGKFAAALEQYDQGIAADRLENTTDDWYHYDKHLLKGQIHEILGEYDEAIADGQHLPSRDPDDPGAAIHSELCRWYVLAGDLERAEIIARRRAQLVEEGVEGAERGYRYCLGHLARARGQLEESVEHFEWIVREDPYDTPIWQRVDLGRAYQHAHRLSEAVREYEAALHRYDESWGEDPTSAVIVHYYAGLAYEESGWNDKAIERYDEFLSIWESADPGIPIVEGAKRRLEKLRAGS